MSEPVVSTHFPFIPVLIRVRDRTEELEALLDTGFSGHIVDPTGFLKNGHRSDGSTIWSLADGSRVRAPYYLGSVSIGPFGPIDALITELGDEPILGLAIANNFHITLDHGQRLTVEP